MKQLAFLLAFIPLASVHAQMLLAENGCLTMYGDSDVDDNGCWYYAYLKNECDKPVYVEKSKFTTRFEYFKETSDDIKDGKTNKTVKIPAVFLAPGTSITKDRDRSDSRSRTYTNVYSRKAEMGGAREGSFGIPVEGAIQISPEGQTFLGSKNGIEFKLELNKAMDSHAGFEKYKVTLLAYNANGYKIKTNAFINYDVYFQGVAFPGSISINKMKPYDTKRRSESEGVVFNFVPEVYVHIKSSNIDLGVKSDQDIPENTGSISSASSSNYKGMMTYQFLDGSSIVYENREDGLGKFVSKNGDTLVSGIEEVTSNFDSYLFDPEAKTYSGHISNFEGDYLQIENLFVSGSNEKGGYYYSFETGKLISYTYFKNFEVDGVSHALVKSKASSKFSLVNVTSSEEINSFSYTDMAVMESVENAYNFSDITSILFTANKNGKWGVVNAFDNVKLNFTYDHIDAELHNSEFYKVYKIKSTNWAVKYYQGLINSNFELVVPCKFDFIASEASTSYHIAYNNISVNTATKIDFYPDYFGYKLDSYQVALIDKNGVAQIPFGRAKFLAFGYDNGLFIAVSKKEISNNKKLRVEVDNGRVVLLSTPLLEEVVFEGNREPSRFTNVESLQSFME